MATVDIIPRSLLLTLSLALGCGESGPAGPPGVDLFDATDDTVFGGGDVAGPLGDIVGDAEVVALGESIHTSEGFSRAKAELIRALVGDLGFRAFAIESPWSEADTVADFVATCDGDPVEAMRGLFPVWGSESLLELVEWLCEYNRDHPADPVRVFGFDTQQPWTDVAQLAAFFQRAAPADAEPLTASLAPCDGAGYTSSVDYFEDGGFDRPLSAADREACVAAITDAVTYLERNHAALIAESSAADVDLAGVALRSLAGWQEMKFVLVTDPRASMEGRDRAMADIFTAVRDIRAPGARTIVWAHNGHIRKRGGDLPQSFVAMGTHLAETLGDDYVPVALTGYEVDVNWPGVVDGPLPTPPAGSVEAVLHDLGAAAAIVDLAAPGGPFDSAALIDFATGGSQRIRDQYRAIVYLERSGPMASLFW